jgi:hypothetical protein
MRHLDPVLLLADADRLERQAERTRDESIEARLRLLARHLRMAAHEARLLDEELTS